MSIADEELQEASDAADAGEPMEVSVRQFLWWWWAQRRTYATVQMIRRDLARFNLETVPDFEATYLDAIVQLCRPERDDEREDDEQGIAVNAIFANSDPTYRVSKLAAANQAVVFVSPDANLEQIVTVMMERDFSQLPVMTSERDVKGIITWRGIGSRLALGSEDRTAQRLMDKVRIASSTDTIFEVIDQIVRYDHVLVRGEDNKITGIITASDLSIQFRSLSEAFLILSEIENSIRSLIEPKFSVDELSSCLDPEDVGRDISGVADLNFGEYIRLLENPDRWAKFDIQIDRKKFCEGLDRVRAIRNDVMHFDPDGIPDDDIQRLRDFSNFLQQIIVIAK